VSKSRQRTHHRPHRDAVVTGDCSLRHNLSLPMPHRGRTTLWLGRRTTTARYSSGTSKRIPTAVGSTTSMTETQRVERRRAQSKADRRTAIPHDITGVVGTDIAPSDAEGEVEPRPTAARTLPASAHFLPSPLLREDLAVRVVEPATRRSRAHGGPTRRGWAGDSRTIRGERAVFGSWHKDYGVRQGGRSSHTAVRTTRVRRGVVLDPGLE